MASYIVRRKFLATLGSAAVWPLAGRARQPATSVVGFLIPRQSPAPGFGEKYWSLSGFPSHSLESGGGAFLTVIFGQILAYSAFSDSHFSSPGSLSAFMASTGHSGWRDHVRKYDGVDDRQPARCDEGHGSCRG